MWFKANLRVYLTPLTTSPTTIKYGFIDAKFGRILIGLTLLEKDGKSCDAICLLYFVQKDDIHALNEAHRRWPTVELIADATVIDKCSKIFSDDQKESTVTIDVAVLGTALQLEVWNALVKLKSGSTITYSELAELIDRPKAVRAVASAVGKNEVSILIPCHRIISKNGAIKYGWGSELKSVLLDYEASK